MTSVKFAERPGFKLACYDLRSVSKSSLKVPTVACENLFACRVHPDFHINLNFIILLSERTAAVLTLHLQYTVVSRYSPHKPSHFVFESDSGLVPNRCSAICTNQYQSVSIHESWMGHHRVCTSMFCF